MSAVGLFGVAPRSLCAVEGIAHRLEVETDDVRSDADRRDTPVLSKATHGSFAHLQDLGELTRGQKFLALLG